MSPQADEVCPLFYMDEDGFQTGWVAFPLYKGERFIAAHIVPANDTRKHQIDPTCWCQPFDIDDRIVHNSADGREKYEPDSIHARRAN